jgi:hypothetical protein
VLHTLQIIPAYDCLTLMCRFFEHLMVDSITVHFTFLPCPDGHRRGNSTLLHVAVATGLSMSDLDDIRISLAPFILTNKSTRPDELTAMISAHFVRQVLLQLLSVKA